MNIQSIRQFNRDLTVYLGVYDRNLFGLHYPMIALRILMEIDNRHGITANQLVDELQFDKGYLSRIINQLVTDEVVVKKQDVNDRRRWQLFTTDKGHQYAKVINQKSDKRVQSLLNKLDNEDQKLVFKSIHLLQNALNELNDENH
ncbi:MAG: MarR family transcriptional regulator [Limosilactobacillus coleohominis]|nr:MarR family transcriptional regulator [Limosilactobacillus coleohominis]MDY3702589.1 MarR family transcriptional regulator [Limosilactobacillus coleohominis]